MHYCQLKGPFPTVYVVRCKRCQRNVPAGVTEFPPNSTVVHCPLCAELRRYRPSEVFLGWPDPLIEEQKAIAIALTSAGRRTDRRSSPCPSSS
jgi:NAD-dependent SIR2 family protein deacetylase